MTDPSRIETTTSQAEDIFGAIRKCIEEMRTENCYVVGSGVLARKLANRAQALRQLVSQVEPSGPRITFLAIRHGAQRFGIPMADVLEVQQLRDYTPVPGAPSFIAGVIHWRGTILVLMDLVKLFGISESGLIDERTFVIVDVAGRRLGFLAGEVEELFTVPLDRVKALPELSTENPPEWVVGVYDENRLILRMESIVQDERLTDWKGVSDFGTQSDNRGIESA